MANRLKHSRRQRGWTQRDLARESGVGLATVRRIEQETFEPRLDTVRRLAGSLRVRASWLAFGDGPMRDDGHVTADAQRQAQATPDMHDRCEDGTDSGASS